MCTFPYVHPRCLNCRSFNHLDAVPFYGRRLSRFWEPSQCKGVCSMVPASTGQWSRWQCKSKEDEHRWRFLQWETLSQMRTSQKYSWEGSAARCTVRSCRQLTKYLQWEHVSSYFLQNLLRSETPFCASFSPLWPTMRQVNMGSFWMNQYSSRLQKSQACSITGNASTADATIHPRCLELISATGVSVKVYMPQALGNPDFSKGT